MDHHACEVGNGKRGVGERGGQQLYQYWTVEVSQSYTVAPALSVLKCGHLQPHLHLTHSVVYAYK